MGTISTDAYGHISAPPDANTMAAGAVGTSAVSTIVGTTAAGAAPTVTAVTANDNYGQFTLNPVTGGGAQAAGEVTHVYFAQSFPKTPSTVVVEVMDITTATAPVDAPAYATSITSAGFAITTNALTTAHNYLITYHVLV